MIRLTALLAVALCASPIMGATFQPSIKRNIQQTQQDDENPGGPTIRDVVCIAFVGVISGYVYSLNKKITALETALNNQTNYENRIKNIEGALARGHKPNAVELNSNDIILPPDTRQNYANVIEEISNNSKKRRADRPHYNSMAIGEQKSGRVYPNINDLDINSTDLLSLEGHIDLMSPNDTRFRPMLPADHNPFTSNISGDEDFTEEQFLNAQDVFARIKNPTQQNQQPIASNDNSANPTINVTGDQVLHGEEAPDSDNASISSFEDLLNNSDDEHEDKQPTA